MKITDRQLLKNIDEMILRIMQDEFPLCERPFAKIAELTAARLKKCDAANGNEVSIYINDIDEEFIISRVKNIYERDLVRRLGPIFEARELGYVSTLAAVSAQPQDIEKTCAVINSYAEVTHNYLRDNKFNIWFTVTARNEQTLMTILEDIKEKTGAKEIMNLRAVKMHKIKVKLEV